MGERLPVIVCPECRRENADGAWFCASCNAYLRWEGGQRPPAGAGSGEGAGPVDGPPAPTSHGSVQTADRPDSPGVGDTGDDRIRTDVPWTMKLPPSSVGTSTREEVQPVEPAEVRPPPVEPPPPPSSAARRRVARPDEISCPRCGRPNEPTRRFCRCGAELGVDATKPRASLPPVTTPEPWYRRLLRGGLSADRRDFRRAMRGLGKGARIRYSQALGIRATVFRTLFVLSGLGLGVSLLGPWGGARGWVSDRVTNLMPGSYEAVPLTALALVPEQPELPGYLPLYAVDGQPTRAWAVTRSETAPGTVEEPCGEAPSVAAAALEVSFGDAVQIDRVTIQAGLDRANEDWSKQTRPRTLDVVFSDGTCERLDLDDAFEPQHRDLDLGGVTAARVSVVDVYPQIDGDGTLMALSELAFERRS